DLYLNHPDVLVIISSHTIAFENSFSMNLHNDYLINFKEFGDLGTTKNFDPDLSLMDQIQRFLRKQNIPFTLNSDFILDYGSAVPLYLLTKQLSVPIIPISYSGLDPKAHFIFGKNLQECLQKTDKRVAVIASGDLSHTLSAKAPAGFHADGKIFDEAIRNIALHVSSSKLLSFDPKIYKHAKQCAYEPLLILLGILDGISIHAQELAYEHPFGVGYLSVEFQLE
ncbi:hypothetical protein CO172_00515, partial [Candidatus Uhrbacteria bacterium CG_4_9_14_3_um_filter_36_7]